MKIKGDKIEGEIFVVGADLFEAVRNVDDGVIYPDEDAAQDNKGWTQKVYRVEVTIHEA